ncbi:MAG: SPOR domain-containing protein [Thermonemataceae bacterium]|nr:SPOR domain-containing protein [Thermonemataceae bacterium]
MKLTMYFLIGILFLPLTLFGQKSKGYQENISSLLPKYTYQKPDFEGKDNKDEIKNEYISDITASLNEILDRPMFRCILPCTFGGFRVQVYAGLDRNEANRIKGIALNLQKDEATDLTFDRPKYKVLSGNFLNREDAKKLLKFYKKHFSDAIIVPAKVKVMKKFTPDELMQLKIQE